MTNPDTQEGTLRFGFRVQLGWGSLAAWGYSGYGQLNIPAGNVFTAISAGNYHSLALRSDGSLTAWGNNSYNQCTVPEGNDFVSVSGGEYHSLALRSDGSLAGWGFNNNGQCDVPAGNDFVAVEAGYYHSLALKSDGSLAAWGWNDYGQCTVPAGNDFVAVSAGYAFSLALKSDGSLAAWGYDNNGQVSDIPAGSGFVEASAGRDFGLALRADGSLAAWGNNGDGQCNVPAGNDFAAVSAGRWHGLALRADGSLAAWGNNGDGQCNVPAGNDFAAISAGYSNSLAIAQLPAPTVTSIDPASGTNDGVVYLTDLAGTGFLEGATVTLKRLGDPDISASNVVVVSDTQITCDFDLADAAAGTWDVVVTNPDTQEGVLPFGFRVHLGWGSLQAWGDNAYGKCNVPAGNDFVAIAAGYQHNLALRSDGSIAAWGDNAYGQCNAPGGTGFAAVAAGGYHSLALRSDGSLVGWGDNGLGQTNVPAGYDFVAVSAGHYFSTALRSDGSVVAWGQDAYGQLAVPAGNDFVALDTGDWHSMALRSDGSIAAWGENTWGQCNVPAGDYTAVAAGWVHSVALRADGSLAAWGFNVQGECNVPAGNDFVAVSSGADHGLGLHADGSITCWGYNVDHQADTPPGNDFVAVSGGYSHSLAIAQHPAPTVGSITPASGTRDGAVNVTDLAGTGFYGAPTVLLRKTGQGDIAAANVVVVSDTHITCDFDLDDAELGDWDVVVVNPDTQEGSLADGFTVLIGPLEVGSVAPNNRAQDSTVNVTITGENLDNVNSVVFSGSGISVSNISVVSPTSVTCRLVIDPAAPVGPRDVTLSASDGKTDTLDDGFTVRIGALEVDSVAPDNGPRDSTVDLTVTGKYLDNVDEVIFSPSGITVSDISVVSPTTVTCTLDLTGAAPGLYDVRLNASDGRTDTLADCFTVEPSPLAVWYLAEGSTDWGFDCYVSVVNPNDEAVERRS